MRGLSLKWFAQSNDSLCGVASVRTVLHYYGIRSTEKNIAKLCNNNKLGCNNEDMVNCLLGFGLGCSLQYNRTIDDLKYWVIHNIPVIIDWFPFEFDYRDKHKFGHSSVIRGFDSEYVYLIDPLQKTTSKILIKNFEGLWFDYDNAGKEISGTMIITYPSKLFLPLAVPELKI